MTEAHRRGGWNSYPPREAPAPELLPLGGGGVEIDEDRNRVSVGAMSRRAAISSEPSGRFEALIELRSNVILRLAGWHRAAVVDVDLWAGKPEQSPGLAVPMNKGELSGIAPIPLCSCGDRGCGNSGVQVHAEIPAEHLELLIQVLEGLGDLPPLSPGRDTWDGRFESGTPLL